MILASGARGPGFGSLLSPFSFVLALVVRLHLFFVQKFRDRELNPGFLGEGQVF